MNRSLWKFCPAALALLALAAAAPAAHAAVFIPNRTTDSADGACDAHCSLREAILAANARAGEDVIVLHSGVYRLSLAGAGEDLGATGDLDIRDDLVLLGDGAVSTIIDAGQIDRVLDVIAGATVEIRDVTLRNGRVQGAGTSGGGVRNRGALTLARSIVTANTSADGFGGGISSSDSDSVLTLSQSTVSDNTAGGGGGGLAIDATANLTNVTISGNRSLNDFGGGIYFFSDAQTRIVNNSTVTGNSAARPGGGIFAEIAAFIGFPPEVANSILAGNTAPTEPDCSGSVGSGGYNLVGNGTGCSGFVPANHDVEGTTGALLDPRLGPLTGNGGPTPTHALLAGSPALDAGNPATPGGDGACEAVDQRTAPRPGGPRCDIGAFEATTACVAGGNTLCLQNGRFKVTATWQTGTDSGEAGAVTLTSDTGYFWFFDPANVEVTLKVLDGCALNDRFWVFLSGLTNVRVDVRVTDTLTGQEKTYTNPQGRVFRAQLDTSAFATCQ